MDKKLDESCREAIDLILVDKIRFKAIMKEKLAEAYLKAKSCGCRDVEEMLKDLLIFLDL
jgi:hypothetical protein